MYLPGAPPKSVWVTRKEQGARKELSDWVGSQSPRISYICSLSPACLYRMVARGRSQSWSGEWIMETTATNHVQAKLVLLGDMGAGKSSLVMRFVKGQFFDYQESTIGAAFVTQTLAVNETIVKFEIWDTAGQERYHSLAPMYYRGAAAAIVVYDMTNPDSFARAKKWVNELQRQGRNPNLVIALAGNKADLSLRRKVEPEEGQAYADEYELFFLETSAKTSLNVNELFYEIARKLPKAQTAEQGGMILTQDRPEDRATKPSACCA